MSKYLVLISVFFVSCFDFGKPERLYFKEIKTADIEIDWFYYSLIGNVTPQYLVATSSDGLIDTICIAGNISEVNISDDIIYIDFAGMPKRYGEEINIADKVFGKTIIVNTDKEYDHYYLRKSYKKE